MLRVIMKLLISLLTFTSGLILAWCFGLLVDPNPEIQLMQGHFSAEKRMNLEKNVVYSAVLGHAYSGSRYGTLVIVNQTYPDWHLKYDVAEEAELKSDLLKLSDRETVESFLSNHRESELLNDLFVLPVKHRLISSEESQSYSSSEYGWREAFQRKNPGSYGEITLSEIGFNQAQDKALVYVGYYCGLLCATGKYYSLVKEGGTWKVVQEYLSWVS
jgi:hypothetical protein